MYAGGVNFTSLLFMNVYRIYILIVWFVFATLLMIWQKGGEVFGEFIYACLFYFLVYAKRKKNLMNLCMFISFYAYMFMFNLCAFIEYHYCLLLYMSKGGVSMNLNFNSCIYNSMSFVIIKNGGDCWPKGPSL